jgi:methylmalonyl-CoA mutase cobalamin-binding domain/chain
MEKVGERYEDGSYFLPDMLTAAEAVEAAMEVLEPHLLEAGVEPRGRVLLATVKGDMHDIGKNIVGLMLKGAGFVVVDLGNDVEPEEIARAVKENNVDMLGMSALLTTTMVRMGETIDELSNQGVRENISIMVGGAPLTPGFAEDIGADGYGKDAFEAIRLAREFTGK